MALTAGTRLGPCEVLTLIGVGEMGEAYRARSTRIDRAVGINFPPPELSAVANRRARIERDAPTIAQLVHPHVCTRCDVGVCWLQGQTMSQRRVPA